MAENQASQASSDMRKLAEAQNPLQVLQNPIVVSTAVGVLGAYWLRKTLYTQRRDIFGWADKKDGRIVYWQVDKNGAPIVGKENKNAYTNRIILNALGVLVGTVLINNSLIKDATADYIGLGVASGSFANLIMTVLQID